MSDPGYHDLPSNGLHLQRRVTDLRTARPMKIKLPGSESCLVLESSLCLSCPSFLRLGLTSTLLAAFLLFNPSLSFYWMSYRAFSLQVQNASKEARIASSRYSTAGFFGSCPAHLSPEGEQLAEREESLSMPFLRLASSPSNPKLDS
ncbi:unnamed protein product [Dovyalis caffra]|uniref:Uncharacterized protein n=1 Tax=Dovyalis caffra TaxID=77055 RepID=A0AAV1R3V9_9ROSI|nr:unnamed protein product [Dovyalis caffra]